MPETADLSNEFFLRLTAFQEGFSWDECDEIIRSLAIAGEMVELVFDHDTAARFMHTMHRIIASAAEEEMDSVSVVEGDAGSDWRTYWANLDAFSSTAWPDLLERTHDLHAFAYYGILPGWNNEAADPDADVFADVPRYIGDTLDRLARFVALFPKERAARDLSHVDRTCLAAQGRLKIDSNVPLTVHELAALTGVSTKRLQNAIYAKTEDAPIPDKNGLIPVASASRWLDARDYTPSIWREFVDARAWNAGSANATGNAPVVTPGDGEDFLFVPEARDGTLFSPKHCAKAGGGYTIGRKGEELHFDDYDDALAALAKMPRPYWRRSNYAGNFGIVVAERWRRLTRRELMAL